MRYPFLSLIVCFLLANQTLAKITRLDPGWGSSEDWEAAQEASVKSGKPIAAIIAFREAPGDSDQQDAHDGGFNHFMRAAALKPMIRLAFFDEDKSAGAELLKGKLGGFSRPMPMLYFVDPECNVIASLDYKSRDRIVKTAKLVNEIITWRVKCQAQIAKADKEALAGKFKVALKAIAGLVQQDEELAMAIVVLRAGDDLTKADGPPSREKTDESRKYLQLTEEKRTEYGAMLSARCKEAKQLLEDGESAKARTFLQPTILDNSDLAEMEEAKALFEQIKKAEISK